MCVIDKIGHTQVQMKMQRERKTMYEVCSATILNKSSRYYDAIADLKMNLKKVSIELYAVRYAYHAGIPASPVYKYLWESLVTQREKYRIDGEYNKNKNKKFP